MKKFKKRFLSAFLSMVFIMGVVTFGNPTTMFAAEEVTRQIRLIIASHSLVDAEWSLRRNGVEVSQITMMHDNIYSSNLIGYFGVSSLEGYSIALTSAVPSAFIGSTEITGFTFSTREIPITFEETSPNWWFFRHIWDVSPITSTPEPPSPLYPISPTADISILINDVELEMDVAPIIIDDRTLVPVRAAMEGLGATVDWDSDTRTVTITEALTIIMSIDSTAVTILTYDGSEEAVEMDVAPIIIDDRTMLPLRFLAETFGFEVDWDDETRTVLIATP